MPTPQESQNQKIIDYAINNFSTSTHEYGRQDLAGHIANKKTGELIDPSRTNKDLDGDGRKGVDCSSLVSYSLQGAEIDVGQSLFTTSYLFNGNQITDTAKKYFDILPSSSKNDGSLLPGDILMLKMPNGAQHVVIFKQYNEENKIVFFGSQTSTGPKEVVLNGNSYWDKQCTYYGALRAKLPPDEQQSPSSSPIIRPTQGSSAPFGARKNSKYKVISTSPSVNKTPRGSSVVNVPYDVQQDLSKSDGTSPNVFFNSDPVYLKTSHSTKVTGDKQGSKGGVKSGTVGAQSDPIQASPSVFVNGKAVVRVGDVQHMQNKNTVGKVTTSESGSAAHINDEGKITATAPEPIPMPYAKNKPTNNKGSGALGSRTGSPVLLKSGKLFYTTIDTPLIAPFPFALQRTYLSDGVKGIFGNGWQCAYETRLIRTDPHTLSLVFVNDQTFRFTYNNKGFIDSDDLGASLTLVSSQTFLLDYFSDAHTELYVNGFLSQIKDRNGNTLDFIRESNGQLVRITSGHVTLSFSYNKEGFVSQVRDHTDRLWSYTYTPQDTLSELADPLGGVTRYTYSTTPHQLTQIIDPSGVMVLSVDYDPMGRVMSYTEEALSYTYRYEPNRVIKTESTGDKTIYGIDNFGAIRAITYPDGSTTREEYHDNTSVVIDEGGNTYIRVFDNRHRLIREITPDKSTILYSYKGNNPYPSLINREDKITTHVYDERYNKLSTTYNDGTSESYSYDDRGNKIAFIDRSGVSTSYAYNDLGQQIRISDALGGVTQNVYDDLGNLATIIDPQERIVQFEYDTLSRRIAITDNARITTRIYHDNAGRISAVREHSGGMTRYAYNEHGFLSRMINPADQLRIYTYEGNRLVSILREDGESYRFAYDKKGRRISQSIGNKTLFFHYDSLGNLLRIEDGTHTIEYVYDVNANVLLERLGDESVSYAYNTDGSKRFIGYEGMHYQLQRDESGNLTQIRRGLESYGFQYDPLKNQTALTYPSRLTQKSQFDPLGRLIERNIGDTSLIYTYDKSSRLTSRNRLPYLYDEAGRVILCDEESYTYDELGNLILGNTLIDPLTHRLLRYGDSEFTYDTLGQMIEKTSPEARTTYTYDIEGYLIGYQRHSASPVRTEPVEVQLHFTYDPLGRRITKHFKSFVVSQSNHETINEYHHRYLYAGDNIVAIYDYDSDELIATLLHDEGIDTPLSISVYPTVPLSSEEQERYESMDASEQYLFRESRIQTYYYHRDHQNSILSLTNKEGKIIESYSYDAFGNITHHTKTLETYNSYGYTGREIDTDDLYYYRARYYDPTIGRFITPDPIGFMGGDTNFYRYVGNDPVNFTDPSGLLANMASALAQLASINRGHSDGNPFNGIVPDTSVSKTVAPNSTIPQGKRNTQTNKPKTTQTTSKTAQTNKGDGTKIKGVVPKIVDECKDKPKLTIRIVRKWEDKSNVHNVSATLSKLTIDEEPSFKAYILEEDGASSAKKSKELAHNKDGKVIYKNAKAVLDEKRVPAGTYDLTWHSSGRKFLKKHHHNKLLKLSNSQVSANRGILIHTGTSAKDSEGCLMIGYKLRTIKDGVSINALRRGLDFDAYNDFMKIIDKYACPKAVKGGKIKNIKLIISEVFIPTPTNENTKKLWWGKE